MTIQIVCCILPNQLHTTEGNNQIHTVQSVDSGGHNSNAEMQTVDLTEATLGQDGQLIITGEDGHGKRDPTSIRNFPNNTCADTLHAASVTATCRLSGFRQWYDHPAR